MPHKMGMTFNSPLQFMCICSYVIIGLNPTTLHGNLELAICHLRDMILESIKQFKTFLLV